MITNPQIGMRVRTVNSDGYLRSQLINRIGTIVEVWYSTITVRLDTVATREPRQWNFPLHYLEPYVLSPEEQERKTREEYAEKYL